MVDPRPKSKRRQRLLVALLALVAGGLLGEVLYRGVRRLQGRPYDKAAVARTVESMSGARRAPSDPAARRWIDPAGQIVGDGKRLVLHPYFGFDVGGDARLVEVVAPCDDTSRAGERFDVLVLGGSVAQMLSEGNCATLAKALASDPRLAGMPVSIQTYARGGYKQPQHAIVLTYLFASGFDVDLVILLDGFNEVALGTTNARHDSSPLFPSLTHWAFLTNAGAADPDAIDILTDLRAAQRTSTRIARWADALHVEHSAVLGDLALAVLGRLRNRNVELQQSYAVCVRAKTMNSPTLHGPPFPSEPAQLFAAIARNWSESSRSIDALCRARGIAFLHVLQPTLHDEGSKPLTAEERRTGTASDEWIEGVRSGYPLLRAAGEGLRRSGVAFVDLSMIFRDISEPVYFDACHFNEAGNAILAREIGAAVQREIDLPRSASGR